MSSNPSPMDRRDEEAPKAEEADIGGVHRPAEGEVAVAGVSTAEVSWARIGDGHPMQDTEGGIVNFEKWLEWILSFGHPLG